MAVLTREQKRFIAGKIRAYHRMKDDIAEWREAVISGTGGSRHSAGRSRRPSDTVAAKAMKLAEPPPPIAEKMAWVAAIDAARGRLRAKDMQRIDVLFELWYWCHHRQSYTQCAASMYVSERTLHNYIDILICAVDREAVRRSLTD